MATCDVRVRLLEGFELTVDTQPWKLPPSIERLVAFLALQPRPVMRFHVAGVLWGDRTEERAAACLRSAIWRANAGHDVPVIDAGRTRVMLHGDVTVDARDAAAAAHKQLSGGSPVDPQVLTGRLLPGWYDDWVVVERERLRQLCLEGMEHMAQAQLDAGRPHLAIEAALAVVATEPLRELAQRILIDAYARVGNRSEALRQFRACRDLLASELGLQPGEELAAAARRVQEPGSVNRAVRNTAGQDLAAVTLR